jgi:predicted RNase H-like HicB family nuclease
MTTYQAIFERAEDGTIWGYIPEVPGVTGSGDTLDEAKASVTDGLQLWLEEARKDGTEIPHPATIGSFAINTA